MRVYLESIGCKLNQSEIETLARQFIAAGHQVVTRREEADWGVVNTCTVTHVAAAKSRRAMRRLRRANPQMRVVAVGCHAELFPADLEADLVVGTADKHRLVEIMEAAFTGVRHSAPSPDWAAPLPIVYHTRAFVKIQDGCDNACAYCLTTIARGPQRSRPLEEILCEVQARVQAGVKEVVLTGVHIGAYGRDIGHSLPELVKAILAETDLPRLRLSSIEPWDLTPELLALWPHPRLCRHLHLPLQSGCDATLRRMGRRYTSAEFARLVEEARARIPDLAVTTDIIVGFPGESEEEFAESYRFVEKMAFSRLHVFPFSARPGTRAATMPDQVSPRVRRERAAAMRALGERSAARFREQFVGRVMEVLWEGYERGLRSKSTGGTSVDHLPAPQGGKGEIVWSGLTDNYLRVRTVNKGSLHNTITPTRLLAVEGDTLRGEVL